MSVEPAPVIRFASPVDAFRFGDDRPVPGSSNRATLTGRMDPRFLAFGPSGRNAAPERYHLYAGWHCPRSHRLTIAIALAGLSDAVSVSYVDRLRDGRGWAFREATGPDPVNGFTLLREAYAASDASYDGPVSIPVLWDCHAHRIVSNDVDDIEVDVATISRRTRSRARPGLELFPDDLRDQIRQASEEAAALSRTITRAVFDDKARPDAQAMLSDLDRRLSSQRYLLGDVLTLADIRLWVHLVRFDAGPNAHGMVGPTLPYYPALWAYSRNLYAMPAFRSTTRFAAFTAPFTCLPDWDGPVDRMRRSGSTNRISCDWRSEFGHRARPQIRSA